jgi:hypothetical protein
MKSVILFSLLIGGAISAQIPDNPGGPTPTPIPLYDVKAITLSNMALVTIDALLPIKDVWDKYPDQRPKLLAKIAAQLDADDELTAKQRIATLTALGIVIPKEITDKQAARLAKANQAYEDILKKVAASNPFRAKAKMDERIRAGGTISQSTRDIVNKALPTPTPAPSLSPTPTPDGL